MPPYLKTFAIFALLGPPLTGVVTALLLGAYALVTSQDPQGGTPIVQQMLMMAAYSVPLSYMMGGVQALGVGLGCAAWVWWKGSLPAAVPLALSIVAWFGFCVFISREWQGSGMALSEVALSSNGAFLLAIHVLAGALCWTLSGRCFGR